MRRTRRIESMGSAMMQKRIPKLAPSMCATEDVFGRWTDRDQSQLMTSKMAGNRVGKKRVLTGMRIGGFDRIGEGKMVGRAAGSSGGEKGGVACAGDGAL